MADVAMQTPIPLPPPSPASHDHPFKVKFGKKHVLELNVGPEFTVIALKERIEVEFGVSKTRQKLVTKGHTLRDDSAVVRDVVKRGGILMLMSSTDLEIEKMRSNADAAQHELLVKEQRRQNKNYVSIARMNGEARHGDVQSMSETFGFMSFETLKGFDDEARAASFLKSLADDVGIRHVMKKYKWQVGKLTEMFPKGKVGVSETCIMGLNVNQGQEIKLRLRTDNLEGFRNHLSVMKVLYHELAHNVHGPHDGKFFKLMREIEKDACEYRDKFNNAEKLGGTHEIIDAEWDRDDSNHRIGGKLGGDKSLQGIFSAGQLAASAAVFRLSAEEETIMQNCGCSSASNDGIGLTKRQRAAQTTTPSSQPDIVKDTPMEVDGEEDDHLIAALKLSMAGLTKLETQEDISGMGGGEIQIVPEEVETSSVVGHSSVEGLGTSATTQEAVEVKAESLEMSTMLDERAEVAYGDAKQARSSEDFITYDIVEMILLANRDASLGEVSSKQKEAEGAIVDLFRCRSKEQVVAALDTLILMVQNMIENPSEEKFKKVRLSNKKFYNTVGSMPGGVKFLLAIGFKDAGNETLVLSRNDPGLLWLGHSILAQVREVAG